LRRDLRIAFPDLGELADIGEEHEGVPNPAHVPVETVMTRDVVVLHPRDTVEEAARLMRLAASARFRSWRATTSSECSPAAT